MFGPGYDQFGDNRAVLSASAVPTAALAVVVPFVRLVRADGVLRYW